jgi:hypothetical protein
MHIEPITLPWFTNLLAILGLFFILWLIFYLLLIVFFPQSQIWWKKIDYVWLAMAGLGIMTSVDAGRQIVGGNLLWIESARLDGTRDYIESSLQAGQSTALCRQFLPSALFTAEELAIRQSEFDAQCLWYRHMGVAIKRLIIEEDSIDLSKFPPYPSGGDQQISQRLKESVSFFNKQVQVVSSLRKEMAASDLEKFLRVIGPVALAAALALRMTKVTADVRAEKTKTTPTVS